VVIGAGLVGLEMCEALRDRDMEVTLLHRGSLPMHRLGEDFGARIVEELETNQVRYLPETEATGFDRAADGSLGVHTGGSGVVEADIAVVAVGVDPDVALAAGAGIRIGETGAVATEPTMQTSLPGVYAAGDCCECLHRVTGKAAWLPLGDTANKQGRIAGTNIGGGSAVFPGVVGSSCFKVFGLAAASTGLTEKEAAGAGFEPASKTIRASSRPHYYPGAAKLWLRLVADIENGRLLGAQAVGYGGVVERVNLLAAAITGEMSVEELAFADFAYAPPFGGAWDPIHIAAQQLAK
jgi:NADPH-dependent 2,4-dienoyl-CoA reductase/sulfur reductase-like enzyme